MTIENTGLFSQLIQQQQQKKWFLAYSSYKESLKI